MTIIIVTFCYPVNPHYQNPGWGSGWAWVWVGLPVVSIFNMATRSIYSPSPPLADLNELTEKFKRRGYGSVGIDSYRVVLPRKLTLSRAFYLILKGVASRGRTGDAQRLLLPLFVIPGLTKPAPHLMRGNPVFLSLKDQKISLLEQRVSNLERGNDFLQIRYAPCPMPYAIF